MQRYIIPEKKKQSEQVNFNQRSNENVEYRESEKKTESPALRVATAEIRELQKKNQDTKELAERTRLQSESSESLLIL